MLQIGNSQSIINPSLYRPVIMIGFEINQGAQIMGAGLAQWWWKPLNPCLNMDFLLREEP